jgi:hypothetical protein
MESQAVRGVRYESKDNHKIAFFVFGHQKNGLFLTIYITDAANLV